MDAMIEAIRTAIAEGATVEQKATGAQACRTILAALEAEVGKPIALVGAPSPGPLSGIAPEQALDLLIARLSAMVPAERDHDAKARPLRIAFAPAPTGARRRKP